MTTALPANNPLRILILGGTRFIGPPLVRALVAGGHAVTLFNRGVTHAAGEDLPPGIPRVRGDRKDLPAFAGMFRELAPDVVIDLIAYTETDAGDLVRTFRGVAGRLVVASSCDVYRVRDRLCGLDPGPPAAAAVPLTEDAPLRSRLYPYRTDGQDASHPKHDYEKILVERAVRGHDDLPATVLRLPAVYGPGDIQHRLFEYLKRMDDARPAILMNAEQLGWRWSRGYVDNVAAAIALAASDARAAGKTYNVADGPALSTGEWVGHIARAAGWAGRVCGVAEDQLPPHLRSGMDWRHDWVIDATRLRADLGYAPPVRLSDALARTIDWERKHPPPIDPAQFDYAAEAAVLASRRGCERATQSPSQDS
jgi:nucleoside-diphosphate-sugar epimerase